MKYLLITLIFFQLILSGKCQTKVDTIIQKGYIIYFGVDGWFFQPSAQYDKSFYQSLNNESFNIRYGTDGYNDALRDFEANYLEKLKHTDTVFYKLRNDTTHFVGPIQYEYVEIVYKIRIDHFNQIKVLSPCRFLILEIHDENKKYDVYCRFLEAEIYSIKRLEE